MSAEQLRPGWRMVRFGDVVRDVKNTTKDPTADGFERVVGLDHLDPESLPLRRWDELDDLPDGTSFTRTFKAGQVLFGKRRAYQRKVAVPDFDGICSGDILVFEPASPDLLPEFLPYLVQSEGFFGHALGTSAGSLSPRTRWQELAKYEFTLPPLDEQKRAVVAMKDSALLASRLEDLSLHTRHLEASLRDALFTASAGSAERSLAELAVVGPQNGVTVAKGDRTGELGYAGMSVMFGDALSVSLAPIESVALEDSVRRKFELGIGDLLFARRSVVLEGAGRCVMVRGLDRPSVFESSIIRVRVDSNMVKPAFLLHYFHSTGGRRLLKSIVRKGAVSGIAGSDLKRLTVHVPSLEVQRDLLLPFTSVDDLAEATLDERARVKDLNGALREALLRGDRS